MNDYCYNEMDLMNQVQTLDEAVCVSLCTNG